MSAINFTGTLGGHDHSFCLTLDAVEELEKATTSGIGALTDRILHRQFRQSDLVHVLRLGLIGAGTPPAEAELLVKSSLHPLAESWGVAVELITRLWSGETKEFQDRQGAGRAGAVLGGGVNGLYKGAAMVFYPVRK